jgi:hypothetical protein
MTQQLCRAVAVDLVHDEAAVRAGRQMACLLRTDRSDDLSLHFGQFMVLPGSPPASQTATRATDGVAWFAQILELQANPTAALSVSVSWNFNGLMILLATAWLITGRGISCRQRLAHTFKGSGRLGCG